MESCLYEGQIQHQRREPIEHSFDVPLTLLYLDLEELPTVFERRWLWSTTRPAPARFQRSDHLGDASVSLSSTVRDRVEAETGTRPNGPIRLLTHPRYFGFGFNPVSFFYCFDSSGEAVDAVLAEVSNTPWNERHCYVLSRHPGESMNAMRRPKEFHVSPFMGMDMDYEWSLPTPGKRLSLGIATSRDSARPFFDASLNLKRVEIGTKSLARTLVAYPLMTAQVMVGIYWQAWRLYRKQVPIHPHPDMQSPHLNVETVS